MLLNFCEDDCDKEAEAIQPLLDFAVVKNVNAANAQPENLLAPMLLPTPYNLDIIGRPATLKEMRLLLSIGSGEQVPEVCGQQQLFSKKTASLEGKGEG